MYNRHSIKVPTSMQVVFDDITNITDPFCLDQLNEEYRDLVRYAIAALCRKKPSPLSQGKINVWACAIIYAIGFVNFLFDKSKLPFMTAADLAKAFGISKSTAGAKAKEVRDYLKLYQLDPNWTLPSQLKHSPYAWMITYNGFIVDVRTLPREIQVIAVEKGIIPYLPDENV